MSHPDVSYANQLVTSEFEQQARAYLNQGGGGRQQVAAATWQLRLEPFGDNALQTHPVRNVRGNLPVYTSKVNRGRRIIWTEYDPDTQVLLLVGEHDTVYRQIEGRRIDRDEIGHITIRWDNHSRPKLPRDPAPTPAGLFDFAEDRLLLVRGVHERAIPLLRTVPDLDGFAHLVGVLEYGQLQAAWAVLEEFSATQGRTAPFHRGDAGNDHATVPSPTVVVEPPLVRLNVDHLQSLPAVEPEELIIWLEKPIEDWMTFLDPAQHELVTRPFAGPARISGAAGTGKTVVGLHRAVEVLRADPGSRVLVTTLVNNLPRVLASLAGRMTAGRA